jgi:chromosome segregation ATPase
MATQAKVTSTEALEKFRAALIVFLTKSKRALDDSGDEVRRTRQWIEHDQTTHWQGEYRRRVKRLEQANQELMSARLSKQRSAIMAREMALNKAKNEVEEAEMKLGKLRRWAQNFESATDPIVKRIERLRQVLGDLPKAITYLASIQKTLEDYAGAEPLPDSGARASSEASEEEGAVAENPEAEAPDAIPVDEPAGENPAEPAEEKPTQSTQPTQPIQR